MSTTTPAAMYLPGDRVVYDGGILWLNKQPGTVVESGSVVCPFAVVFDNEKTFPDQLAADRDGQRRWHTHGYFTRQPIEPGCRVRWLEPSPVYRNLNGMIVSHIDKQAYSGKDIVHFVGSEWTVYLKDVVRIAEPAPAAVHINNGGMRIDLGNGRLTITAGFDHLKQAQDLARALDAKHFNGKLSIDDNLTGVLNQIDNMTAGMVHMPKYKKLADQANDQIGKLASFITLEVPGEPSRDENAVDTAIRVMRRQEAALTSVCKLMRENPATYHAPLMNWLAEFDPTPPVTFKRGDLVTWGAGQIHGRIVKMPVQKNDPHEVIVTVVQNGGHQQLGKFLNLSNGQDMRHSPLK